MANVPDIFCIHESDADVHLGYLRQSSQKFIDQERVGEFVPLSPEEAITALPDKIESKDLIILLLTDQLNVRRDEIKELLARLKIKYSGLIIAEVIIDHIQYDKDYISWPSDLAPIRSRDDMDTAWSGIETNLNQIIPPQRSTSWKRYLKPVAAVLAAALLIWLVPKLFRSNKEPGFSLKIMESKTGTIYSDTSECYLPCLAILSTPARGFDSLMWQISDTDTTIRMQTDFSYLFGVPGEHSIKLTVQNGNRKKRVSRQLVVKPPLIADFDAGNDGCIAPCFIDFQNKTGNGTFSWKFDGIDDSLSTEANPRREYKTANEQGYKVTLSVVNEDGLRSDTVKKVTIRRDNSPFADFSTKRAGRLSLTSRTVQFVNTSKNANEYEWKFGDGSPPSNEVSPTHTYEKNGTYRVTLIARQGSASADEHKDITVGIWYGTDIRFREAIEQNPHLKAQEKRLQETRIQNP